MDNTTIKQLLLMRGNSGPRVSDLKKALGRRLAEQAHRYPGLAKGDLFDADTETALRAWQSSVGLVADGIAGPRTLAALLLLPEPKLKVEVSNTLVGKLFPYTKSANIARNLPYVNAALAAFGLTELELVATALGTIRAETEAFAPIAELPSHFNTLPGQPAFSAYDGRLGNQQPGDGARFRGRGFVQLTGRDNYLRYGTLLDIPLADNPDSACAPEIAACLLAAFLHHNRTRLTKALATHNLKAARKVINGGSHGLDRFCDTYNHATTLWLATAVSSTPKIAAGGIHKRARKAAAPGAAISARKIPASALAARRANLNVRPDPADLRDRPYTPPPRSLAQQFPADSDIATFIGTYTRAGLILDQGQEGACTGFGLACVINYLRWRGAGMPKRLASVSPRMLYHFARRYDEYAGENYEGSSCRGALKGWYHNGVCSETKWPYALGDNALPSVGWDRDAVEHTLGVYYRIDTQSITDMQAAIQEVGAIYASAYTHAGWQGVQASAQAASSHASLPIIDYDGKPQRSGGHAFALVGFNRDGFILQNSWGKDWGSGGFAVIRYDDWLAHAMDAWVAALGVPGVVSGRLANGSATSTQAAAAANIHWWDESKAYQHSIVLGNNGRVSRFDQQDAVTRTLQHQACVLPDNWFRQSSHEKKRLVIYAHGGLNSEADAIKRVRAMGRYFLGNGCYPLFLVWKSGLLESIGDLLKDKLRPGAAAPHPALAGNWFSDKINDPVVEKTIGRPFARPLWSEMKENAQLAAVSGRGGDLFTDALQSLASSWGEHFEIHLMGHSAGSIILGRLLDNLAQKNLTQFVRSTHLYAPACTVDFANRHYATHAEIMKRLHLHILSDACELDDHVAYLYQKSLLYLVSNALEADARTPILGLENSFNPHYSAWDGASYTAETLINWRSVMEEYGLGKRLSVHHEEKITTRRATKNAQQAQQEKASHGGFDNNVDLISTTLQRITGHELALAVDDLVGF